MASIRKHTINLYEGDYDALAAIYDSRLKPGAIIRNLVRKHIEDLRAGRKPGLKIDAKELELD